MFQQSVIFYNVYEHDGNRWKFFVCVRIDEIMVDFKDWINKGESVISIILNFFLEPLHSTLGSNKDLCRYMWCGGLVSVSAVLTMIP